MVNISFLFPLIKPKLRERFKMPNLNKAHILFTHETGEYHMTGFEGEKQLTLSGIEKNTSDNMFYNLGTKQIDKLGINPDKLDFVNVMFDFDKKTMQTEYYYRDENNVKHKTII